MSKTVETVLGPIKTEEMGFTLTHEHLYVDCNNIYRISYGAEKMSDEILTREMRETVMKDLQTVVFGYKDNIRFDNVDDMVRELEPFKAAGGKTIFEVTTVDLGRDPLKLKEIAEKSGVNIIMGGTYYYYPSMDGHARKLVDEEKKNELAELMIREFYEGVGDTGIKPGVLGELGLQHDDRTNNVLMHAACIAQKETKKPLIVHYAPYEILDVAEEEGADVTKIVMGHWSTDFPVEDAIKRGAWVSFDQIGMNFPGIIGDDRRADDVKYMFDKGWQDRLLLSHDIAWKVRLKKYGGEGYDDMNKNFFPKLEARGITKEQINRLMTVNPQKLFE